MTSMPEIYLGAATILVVACGYIGLKRQKGVILPSWYLAPYVFLFILVALLGVYGHNYDFLKLWVNGEEVYFDIRTPFNIHVPLYYVICLAFLLSPVVLLIPYIYRRPWIVGAISALATLPITYSKLT